MKILLVTIILCTMFGCNITSNIESVGVSENKNTILPADWKLVNQCGVEFYIPSNLKEEEVTQPYDSCVKEYKSENLRLSLDVLEGASSSDFTRSKDYSNDSKFNIQKVIVNDQQAEIITFFAKGKNGMDYHAVLDIPQMNLTTWAHSKIYNDQETVIKIFKSIKLSK